MGQKNFTRKELINKIHKKIGFSKNFSSSIIDNFFEILAKEISKSNKVKITSFGTFKILKKNERIGRNPKTKEEKEISKRDVVLFKPSKEFKELLNNNIKNAT